MQTKTIAILAAITVGIIAVGIVSLGQDYSGTVGKYAIDEKTIFAQLQNNELVLVVDIRTAEQYKAGHLNVASHDDYSDPTTLEKRVTTIQKRLPEVASSHNIILVNDDGTKAMQVAQIMTEMGIQTYYLEGGMYNISEDLASSSQIIIDSKELMQKIASDEVLYLLAVREPDELLESKIEGAVKSLLQIYSNQMEPMKFLLANR